MPVPDSSGDAHDDVPPRAARIDEPTCVGDVGQVAGPFADRLKPTRLGESDELLGPPARVRALSR